MLTTDLGDTYALHTFTPTCSDAIIGSNYIVALTTTVFTCI